MLRSPFSIVSTLPIMHLKIVLLDGQDLANAGQFIVIGEVQSHKAADLKSSEEIVYHFNRRFPYSGFLSRPPRAWPEIKKLKKPSTIACCVTTPPFLYSCSFCHSPTPTKKKFIHTEFWQKAESQSTTPSGARLRTIRKSVEIETFI